MSEQSIKGECIVVDNNSDDATAEVAKSHGANQVVFEPVNQIARARNSGAHVATGQFLIFIDADTRIAAKLLSEALRKLETGNYVGGGSVVHFEGEISTIGRFGIGLWERISKLTQIAAGSFIFCRRDAFEAIGGFDQKLYASEEVRLSRLLKKWARSRQMRFEILTLAPARTSARKLQWYSGLQILGWVAFMIIAPIAVRSRKLCGFWYQRPKKAHDLTT